MSGTQMSIVPFPGLEAKTKSLYLHCASQILCCGHRQGINTSWYTPRSYTSIYWHVLCSTVGNLYKHKREDITVNLFIARKLEYLCLFYYICFIFLVIKQKKMSFYWNSIFIWSSIILRAKLLKVYRNEGNRNKDNL